MVQCNSGLLEAVKLSISIVFGPNSRVRVALSSYLLHPRAEKILYHKSSSICYISED